MTDEDKAKLKRVIAYFGSWYDVIGLDNVKILEKSISYIEYLEKENAELKAQIEEMKSETEDLIKAQSLYIEDDYNAGVLNGLITVFNSIFEEKYWCCKWNENKNKWEPEK